MRRHQWSIVDGTVASAGNVQAQEDGRDADAEKQRFHDKRAVAFQIVHDPLRALVMAMMNSATATGGKNTATAIILFMKSFANPAAISRNPLRHPGF